MDLGMNVCPLTLNTTRICGRNSVDFASEISKIGFANIRPNAVILINKYEVFDGIASAPLVHFPINAPILLTDPYNLPLETLSEIQRLSPKGYHGVQVILVGNISTNIVNQLKVAGLTSKLITGSDHYETACKIPGERKDFKNILIVSGEDYSEGIVSSYWSAHHGDPILFVRKNDIPSCTLNAIKKMHNVNLYIIGSPKTVSITVEATLLKLSNVKELVRISGNTPYEVAVNFAKYKDSTSEFGWGRNYKEGHAFAFGILERPMEIITSVILAHMGKHSPLLLIKSHSVPDATSDYLKAVKPMPPKDMPRPPFMHGFILGNTNDITFDTQVKIEDTISLEH
jgi:putative cell wall-binding protein